MIGRRVEVEILDDKSFVVVTWDFAGYREKVSFKDSLELFIYLKNFLLPKEDADNIRISKL
jgi:hypothetical protein